MDFKLVKMLIQNKLINEADKEIYEYALFVILFNLLCMICSLIVSWLLHDIKFIIKMLFFFIPIRILMGGFHCSKPQTCIIFFSGITFIVVELHKAIFFDFYGCIIFTVLFLILIRRTVKLRKKDITLYLYILALIYLFLFFKGYREVAYSVALENFLYLLEDCTEFVRHS